MNVKGAAFLARRSLVIASFGEEKWNALLARLAKREPFFRDIVLPVTQIPAQKFLLFNEMLIAEFFGGDPKANWRLGEKGAEWALGEGPYKHLVKSRDVDAFIATAPKLWSTYYDEGAARAVRQGSILDMRLMHIPVSDVFFEYAVLGYFKRGLELVGANVKETRCIKGFSKGDHEVHYQFVLG
jgi:hypothetical protein